MQTLNNSKQTSSHYVQMREHCLTLDPLDSAHSYYLLSMIKCQIVTLVLDTRANIPFQHNCCWKFCHFVVISIMELIIYLTHFNIHELNGLLYEVMHNLWIHHHLLHNVDKRWEMQFLFLAGVEILLCYIYLKIILCFCLNVVGQINSRVCIVAPDHPNGLIKIHFIKTRARVCLLILTQIDFWVRKQQPCVCMKEDPFATQKRNVVRVN